MGIEGPFQSPNPGVRGVVRMRLDEVDDVGSAVGQDLFPFLRDLGDVGPRFAALEVGFNSSPVEFGREKRRWVAVTVERIGKGGPLAPKAVMDRRTSLREEACADDGSFFMNDAVVTRGKDGGGIIALDLRDEVVDDRRLNGIIHGVDGVPREARLGSQDSAALGGSVLIDGEKEGSTIANVSEGLGVDGS